jgi:hypothetical protein
MPAFFGCGGSAVTFTYPPETLQFPAGGFQTPDIYLGVMKDLRPNDQRTGKGRFVSITFPSDEAWSEPVTSIYRQALTQDLSQTDLVSLVPLPAQADYTLEADILSFTTRLKRSAASFLLPVGVGMGLGLALGEDSSDKVKVGIAASVIGLLLIPLPARNHATVEVRMRLIDLDGQVVWEQQCLGEVDEGKAVNATARDDQKIVDEYLTRAVKRCNACLLGQLRQELVTLGGS